MRPFFLFSCSLILFFCVFVGSVWAAEKGILDESLLKFDKNLTSLCNLALEGGEVKKTEEVSAAHHVPADGGEYEAGVDVHGEELIPADLKIPEGHRFYPMLIPIDIDLIEKFDLDVPIGVIMDPQIAGIRVMEGGVVQYNGNDVSGKVQDFCKKEIEHHKALYPALPEGADVSGEHH